MYEENTEMALHFYFTTAVNNKIAENKQFAKDVVIAVKKYCRYDWGNISVEDKNINDEAVKNGNRIVAAYETCCSKIYIITEVDRSITTILFAEEY
jgi:hypothetical protein